METKIKQMLDMIAENYSPDKIREELKLPPGCKFKSWTEDRWNQIDGCWEKRKCGEIYDCDNPSNNNKYCGPWGC